MSQNKIEVLKIKLLNNPANRAFKQPIIEDADDHLYLSVEINEEFDEINHEYKLNLRQELLNDTKNYFDSSVTWGIRIKNNVISFNHYTLFLDLFNLERNNIGSYLLNKLIFIAQDKYPEAKLPSFSLKNESEFAIVNLFSRIGIFFTDGENRKDSVETKLKDMKLNSQDFFHNITKYSVSEYLFLAYRQEQDIKEEYRYYNSQLSDITENLELYYKESLSLIGSWFITNNDKKISVYKSQIKPFTIISDDEPPFRISNFLQYKVVPNDLRNLRILTHDIIQRINSLNDDKAKLYSDLEAAVNKINKMQLHPFFYALLNLITIKR